MGYLDEKIRDIPVVGQVYHAVNETAMAAGIDISGEKARRNAAKQRAIDVQTQAMADAARRQQIDLLAQAKGAADAQADLAQRQAIQERIQAQQESTTPGQVDVSLTKLAEETNTAIRAKKRKQFGLDQGGYVPGVTL
jgi:hypothetical protein